MTLRDQFEKLLTPAMRKEGFSSTEAADSLGISTTAARLKIKTLFRQGLLEFVGEKTTKNIRGWSYKMPIYKFRKGGANGK